MNHEEKIFYTILWLLGVLMAFISMDLGGKLIEVFAKELPHVFVGIVVVGGAALWIFMASLTRKDVAYWYEGAEKRISQLSHQVENAKRMNEEAKRLIREVQTRVTDHASLCRNTIEKVERIVEAKKVEKTEPIQMDIAVNEILRGEG